MASWKTFYVICFFILHFLLSCYCHREISIASYNAISDILKSCEASEDIFQLRHGIIIKADHLRKLSSSQVEEYSLHDIIIWDPLSFGPSLFLWCPNCLDIHGFNNGLKATRWKEGKTACDRPRSLYGLHNEALLVSRVYICSKGHQIIAHDPSILSSVRSEVQVPFVLFHKVGITKELQHFILTHANVGMSISDIQTLWLQTMYDAYGSRKNIYIRACQRSSRPCLQLYKFNEMCANPGSKIITSVIAREYFSKEHLYAQRMMQMTCNKWLSCDHTFKVSANIGYWLNKKWIKLYDTLFIVLNEDGLVLCWKLCKGTKFSSVHNLLKLLQERLDAQGKDPPIILLDNCCSWRKKMTQIFNNSSVKLDIFHAVQRVVKKIPKKKGCTEVLKHMRRTMIKSFRQVFRDPSDRGEQRLMLTPSPEVILKNIDMFLKEWKSVEINSSQILPSSAVREIEKLKCHITKGCLSGIPPSAGTNRNEVLHKTLNKSLKHSRIGIELAIAFLGIFFYRWNEKKISTLKNKSKAVNFIRPVETYGNCVSSAKESFGGSFNFKDIVEVGDCEFSDNLTDSTDSVNCVNHLLQDNLETYSSSETDDGNSISEETQDSDEFEVFLTSEGIAHVIQVASNLTSLSDFLKDIKSEFSSRNANHLMHLKKVLPLLSSKQIQEESQILRDLDALLLANNMERITIAGDGNCFFVSLATMIKEHLSNGTLSDKAKAHIENTGLKLYDNIGQMATTLRQIVVKEWLSNPSDYKPFLINESKDFNEEAKAFLEDGYFASELGNSMPLAASNALCIPIVILTAMSNFPIVPVSPRNVINDTPIFLAYDMEFAGHYDAIKQHTLQQQHKEIQSPATNNKQTSCRCGQGAKKKNKTLVSCSEYKSGCKCFQNVAACSESCGCINCHNPRGKRPQSSSFKIEGTSRKRRHHELTTKAQCGKQFSECLDGGTTAAVHWTLFEELVLVQIILALSASESLDPDTLFQEYNHLVNSVSAGSVEHQLGKKTLTEVSRKLSSFLTSQKVFETLLKEQLRLNFGKG